MNNELEDLKNILSNNNHPLYHEYELTLRGVFYCLSNEFNKKEYLKAFQTFKEFEKSLGVDEYSDNDIYIEKHLMKAVQEEEVWELITNEYYVKFLYEDVILTEILQYHFASPFHLISNKIEKKYIEIRSNLKLEGTEGQLERKVLDNRFKYLLNPKVIVDLQKEYIQRFLGADFRKRLSSLLTSFSSEDIMESLELVFPEVDLEWVKTKKHLLYFFNHPKVMKRHVQILKLEENLGFVTYQELVEHGKKILFKRLETCVFVSKYFKVSSILNNNRKRFLKEFETIGPYNIHLLYSIINYDCMSEIFLYFSKVIELPLIHMDDEIKENYLKQLSEIININSLQVEQKIENHYSEVAKSFEDIFKKGIDARNHARAIRDEGREQDLLRGVISTLSPILLLKNIYRINSEESGPQRAIKSTDLVVDELYKKYINSLHEVEKSLNRYYENMYDQIYLNVFLPFIKKAFKAYEPVRRYGGYSGYQIVMFGYVSFFRDYYSTLKTNPLSLFSDYIKNEYFNEKTLKYNKE